MKTDVQEGAKRLSAWERIPVIVRAALTGAVATAVGTLPWAFLVNTNLKYLPGIPWAVFPAALHMWVFWRYVAGRPAARANRLSEEVWAWAIFAGILGLGALLSIFAVLDRTVRLPAQGTGGDFSKIPFPTLFVWLVMGSLVAGIVEESSFRGYMQGPIERRHGPVVAILLTGSVFGLAHFVHPEVTLKLMPFYLGAAAVYGTLAYLTNSILPGMVLHAGGNILGGMQLFTTGRAEWQASPVPGPLIWETGPDASFWISCLVVFVAGAATVWAYVMLAAVTSEYRARSSR